MIILRKVSNVPDDTSAYRLICLLGTAEKVFVRISRVLVYKTEGGLEYAQL